MQVPASSVLSLFTVVLSFEPAYADLWDSKRLLGRNSFQGRVFPAVLEWPVILRIMTHSALLAQSLLLFALGTLLGVCFMFAAAFICWMLL